MRRVVAGLVLSIVIAFGARAGAGGRKRSGSGGDGGKKPAAVCRADKDCVLVPDGCCGCMQGGKQKAIPAADRKKDEADRTARCKTEVCAQVVSSDASCNARAVCKAGACALSTAGP